MASTEATQSFVHDATIKPNERQSSTTYTELTIHAPISKYRISTGRKLVPF